MKIILDTAAMTIEVKANCDEEVGQSVTGHEIIDALSLIAFELHTADIRDDHFHLTNDDGFKEVTRH